MNDVDKLIKFLEGQLEVIHPWDGERTFPKIKPERIKIGGSYESIGLGSLDISFTFENGIFVGITNHRMTTKEQEELSHYVKELGYKIALEAIKKCVA